MSTERRRVVVRHDGGLHARPASRVARRASEFESEIALVLDWGVQSGQLSKSGRRKVEKAFAARRYPS